MDENNKVEENNQPTTSEQPAEEKKGNFGWAVLGFFVPIVGLILFIVWRNDNRGDSKMAGIGALVGFVFNIIMVVIRIISAFSKLI